MGNFGKQQEARKEIREKDRASRETLGKYFYDLSKLSFGAMVIGVIVPWFSDLRNQGYLLLFSISSLSTFFFAYFGYKILNK
jgi:hypothetical protein